MAKSAKKQPGTRARWKRRAVFPLLAIAIGLTPFLALELTLRFFDVAKPAAYVDPYFGFGSLHPLFDLDEEAGVYRLSRSRSLFFGDQQFTAQKGPQTFRIFCLGGSTVRGRPYTVDTSFTRWLQLELNARDPSRDYEVVNCGGLSYASYRLARILTEVIEYQPDLIVIATGHNEFLEDRTYADVKGQSGGLLSWFSSLRTVTLVRSLRSDSDVEKARKDSAMTMPGEVDTRLDERSGYASYHRDEAWQAGVVEHFETSMEDMLQQCKQAGVPLMLVRLGSNLRDCPPVKSEFAAATSADQQRDWNQLFEQAGALIESPHVALSGFRLAEGIDDQYALLHYRIARCLDQLAEFEAAAESYQRAKQLDICPLRILSGMQYFIQQLASETGTPLVYAGQRLRDSSPQQIAGNNAYVDHVHPTIRSHQLIGQWIAEEIAGTGIVNLADSWPGKLRRAAYRQQLTSLRSDHFSSGRRRVGWLEGWAHRSRMQRELVPVDGRGHVHLGQRYHGFDEPELAWAEFEIAMQLDLSSITLILDFGLELLETGRPRAAELFFQRLSSLPGLESWQQEIAGGQLVSQLEQLPVGQRASAVSKHADQISQLPAESRWHRLLSTDK